MMNRTLGILLIAAFACSGISQVQAQVNGSNLLEYQHGRLPGDTADFSSFYDRAIIDYRYKKIKASVGIEQFHTPFEDRNYIKLTKYSLKYKAKPLEVNVGNFYETIGRGLLLRSFEIPGALLEDISYRSKQYFHRDMLGASAKVRHKNFSAKALYGRPLNNVYPPIFGDTLRRTDIVEAVYADYTVFKQTPGISLMRLTNSSGSDLYGMFTLSGKLFPFMSYYTEVAKDVKEDASIFSKESSYALYGGVNLYFNNIGVSAEYKNYNNFLLGSGINEPPALVKEHTYKVLNRSTHVLQPLNEKGYQVEAYYTFPNYSTLTLNNTIAINNFGEDIVFQEYFAEYSFMLKEKHDIKLFADYAEDPFKLQTGRVSAGSYADWKVFEASTISTNYEFQKYRRQASTVQNHVMILGYGYKSKIIVNIVAELSNDSFVLEDGEDQKVWIGSNVKYQVNSKNSVQVFAGQRRGGPACHAGVCYEVLDFTGFELRLTSRF